MTVNLFRIIIADELISLVPQLSRLPGIQIARSRQDRRSRHMRERVTLHGILRGNDGHGPCTIKTTLMPLAGRGIKVVIEHPSLAERVSLPDGDYDLLLEGECYQVRLENGHLLSRGF